MQKAGKAADELFRVIVEVAPNAILVVDQMGRITLANTRAEEVFGYVRSELIDRPVETLVPDRFRNEHVLDRLSLVKDKNVHSMGAGRDLYGRRKDGSEVPIEIRLSPIQKPGETLVLASIIDITERKKREEQLLLQSAALECAANAIVITDVSGQIVWVNRAFTESTGYSRDEIKGQKTSVLKSGKQDAAFYENLWSTITSGRVWRDTIINRRKDGSLNREDMTITPITDISGKITHFIAIKQDITELEQALSELQVKSDELAMMTEQLWQASRLATVGELAASIAHELNNPLATVSLKLETLGAQLAHDPNKLRAVNILSGEVERMGNLVGNLLQFSRRNQKQVSTVDICDEIDKSLELVEYHLRSSKIEVVRDYGANLPPIQADRQQLRQVFLNLFTNASDAMKGGGTLTVKASMVDDEGISRIRIDFTDSGSGIDSVHLEKIWDPFFTTKPEGKGTGLGLAICRRVIEEHHGSISIESELDHGTTITIDLPITAPTPRPDAEVTAEQDV